MLKNFIALVLVAFWTVGTAEAFEIGFDWSGLKLCTSGNPNRVANPTFTLKDVPAGTKYIRFKLVDRDVPGYNHGGGLVAYSWQTSIARGAFKYKVSATVLPYAARLDG
jgi:hypothetical protein